MNTDAIEAERLNGKCIMAIKYIKDQHEWDDRYPRNIDHFENLARWMEYSVEDVRNLDSICDMLSISGMAWHIVLREKGNNIELTQAKDMLIELLAKRVHEILENYSYSFDIIKYAMPVQLKDDTKEICEDNIENMFIIGVHSKDIYEKCRILRERAERKSILDGAKESLDDCISEEMVNW